MTGFIISLVPQNSFTEIRSGILKEKKNLNLTKLTLKHPFFVFIFFCKY